MSTAIATPRRRARLVTVVWGVVLLTVAALLLLSQFVALSIDPVVVALGLLVGVGLALVAGGLLSLRGRGTPAEGDDDAGAGSRHGEDTAQDPTRSTYDTTAY